MGKTGDLRCQSIDRELESSLLFPMGYGAFESRFSEIWMNQDLWMVMVRNSFL